MRWIIFGAWFGLSLLGTGHCRPTNAQDRVPVHGVFEATLTAQAKLADPFRDLELKVTFESPSGASTEVDGFWDGERTWRVRFSPSEIGSWTWGTRSDPVIEGLHEKEGSFQAEPYRGKNPIMVHGPLRLSDNRRFIISADGTPFFWLGDTAWNGVLRAQPEDWDRYLQTRSTQGFSVIQFVTTQWRGGREVLEDRAFDGVDAMRINPEFYQKRDPLIRAINDRGMIAAPILLWALTDSDPGRLLPIDEAIRLARYEVARYGAYQVVWLLGGDGRYTKPDEIERWKAIGRGVFGVDDSNDRGRLATLHPSGQSWVGQIYPSEPWYDFIGYQSGHGDNDDHLRWLTTGPPAQPLSEEPPLPIINLEPNYETHPSYHSETTFNDYHVRRASYWSLLVAPTAGVTFGHNATWVWNDVPGPAENHGNIGTVDTWETALETPGVESMAILRRYFETFGPWEQLRPAPELITDQPGLRDPGRFIAASQTLDRSRAIIYSPSGGGIRVQVGLLEDATARWFNPRSGEYIPAEPASRSDTEAVFQTPENNDWILEFQPTKP